MGRWRRDSCRARLKPAATRSTPSKNSIVLGDLRWPLTERRVCRWSLIIPLTHRWACFNPYECDPVIPAIPASEDSQCDYDAQPVKRHCCSRHQFAVWFHAGGRGRGGRRAAKELALPALSAGLSGTRAAGANRGSYVLPSGFPQGQTGVLVLPYTITRYYAYNFDHWVRASNVGM